MCILPAKDVDSIKTAFQDFIQNPRTVDENTLLFKNRNGVSIRACLAKNGESIASQNISLLSPLERQRLNRFKAPQRAAEFYVGRILAKKCWADFEGNDSSELDYSNLSIEIDHRSSPYLISASSGRKFNTHLTITHKHGIVIVVASKATSLGIDLEYLSKRRSSPSRWMAHNIDDKVLAQVRATLQSENSSAVTPEINTVLWSVLEAGFKAFSDRTINSPLELILLSESNTMRIIPKNVDKSLSKNVSIIVARPYVLSLVS